MLAVCIGCGCDDNHACPFGCYWLRVDYSDGKGVCSDCVDHCEAWDMGDRTSRAPSIAEEEAEMRDDQAQLRTLRPVSPKPAGDAPCPHDWPYDMPAMEDRCRWCNCSFSFHVHMECP